MSRIAVLAYVWARSLSVICRSSRWLSGSEASPRVALLRADTTGMQIASMTTSSTRLTRTAASLGAIAHDTAASAHSSSTLAAPATTSRRRRRRVRCSGTRRSCSIARAMWRFQRSRTLTTCSPAWETA